MTNSLKAPKLQSLKTIFPIIMVLIFAATGMSHSSRLSQVSSKWKITSIKICKLWTGSLDRHLEIIGQYPVYSFFIPRPVWTVNGTVVEAQPVQESGKIVAFKLLGASVLLKPDARNSVKFSLPDQTGSKTFYYNTARPLAGECYEFF